MTSNRFLSLAFHRSISAIIVAVLLAAFADAQQTSGSPQQKKPFSYEDDYVDLTLLPGWNVQPRYEEEGQHGVLLTSGNYKLFLRFHAEHASGIVGGRLSEALSVRWLRTDDVSDCFVRFRPKRRRVGQSMPFYSLTLAGSDCDTRVDCGIKRRIGVRWVGGYFSPDGAYFFGPKEARVFTLTYDAEAADQLPFPGDPVTERAIREAAAIVNSIRYKEGSRRFKKK